ncbi:IgGFc-binding protein-like isoform 2-T2 [Spinachia spinachia]
MEIRPFAVCFAVCAALLAVCHGCSTGNEFITTFLPNAKSNGIKDHQLHVVLTSQGSEADVHIQVASVKFHRKLRLAPGESRRVSLPCKAELQRKLVNANSAVRITSSTAISVVSFNQRFATGDGTVVSPTKELGTDYFVFTPSSRKTGMDSVFAIVNGNNRNQITIKLDANVRLTGGTRWQHRKTVTIVLEPYASYLVRSPTTLTGTQIQSQRPVAVLAGHQCLSLGGRCEHVYEQLPAVASLGTEYIVPRTGTGRAINFAVIVAIEDNTKVTLQRTWGSSKQKLRTAGDVTIVKMISKQSLVIKGDKKVMVLLLSDNRPFDPFLITLTPTNNFATDWAVDTMGGLPSTVFILSEKKGAGSVEVCVKEGQCLSPKWQNLLSDEQWVWSNVAVGTLRGHVTVQGDGRMAVYAYGGKKRHAYGISGVCYKETSLPATPTDPCEQVKCRIKESCVKGKCVHVSTATCRAVGDPHYLTFDGRRFDFQGTCTYIMTTVLKTASNLLPFTVTTTNNHRGNNRVSFVRSVTVTVLKQTIIIGSQRGQVQVNGELQYLPVVLLGGKVSIRQSGIFAKLTADFGLRVKYDWNMRLYITVPSSYFQHLGGLCGNYNGERSDDLPQPKESSISAVLNMIQKWKTNPSDLFCHDNCAGHCPECSKKQQAHFTHPNLCGILTKTNGPFSACHNHVDPSMYLDNCVYDVCVNKGAKQVLCDNLKSYADSCMSEDVKINPQWRMISKCFLSCAKGSHYEACGSPCPASCVSPDSEKLCKGPCVEGCQCDEGLVLSGDRCVPLRSCGCQHKGRYYPAAFTFWGDKTCTTKCKCLKGKAKCKPGTCKKKEHCALEGGVRDCYPTSYATCRGSGDPHYRSFDGRRFDFQGTCTYILSQLTKGLDPDLEPFQVLVKNENRARNKAAAYTKSVSLTVFGNLTVSMSCASVGRIVVNSRPVNLPYSTEDGKLSLFQRGYFGFITTNFGLKLKFNWKSHVTLTVPSSYSSATSGLCGNYNGKPGDDLQKPDGTQATHVNAFGDSWKAGGDPGCTSDCPAGKCPECKPALISRYQKPRYCGIIADKLGPFGQCHSKLDHSSYLTDCVFDLCVYQGHAFALCNSLSTFSTSCQEAGAKVGSWRTKQFCPPSCGANSHYEICAPTCPLTCSDPTMLAGCEENALCAEGCVCDDGFILSHDKCVPLAKCGCQYEGHYYQNGQVFYPRESCDTRCVCSEGGQVQCNPKFGCSANEGCVVKGGVASCSPKSIGSCSVSGVRNIRTFDGQAYPLWGNCLFNLAEVNEENEGGRQAFSVFVQQQTDEDGTVSRSVALEVYGMEITMEIGAVWEIKVDEIRVSLPVVLADGQVRAHQNGINIIIETDFDLKLTYDSVAGVILQIPSTYSRLPRGLCGNYNGKPSDDLASTARKRPADPLAAWVVTEDSMSCDTRCGAGSCPNPDKQKVPEAKKACDIIRAQNGPFAGCHSTVSPTPNYDACVREMSTEKGDADILCRHIQNYVRACQLAGTKISKWRSDTFCPVKCPARSHYELCSTSCSSTCFSLQESGHCPACQEGCQCDDGLMSDGVRCVSIEECGCVVDGQYYGTGKSVVLEDCSERCVCHSGIFSCSSTSCKQDEECNNNNGTLSCYSKDPCAEVACRVKEHCQVSEGKAVCVPDSTAICRAYGDPHYRTFDGFSYSFQGTCTYVLVTTTGLDPSLPKVTVITKNEHHRNSKFSFVRSTIVEMLGHQITISNTHKGFVLVDGIKTQLPVILKEGSISVTRSGIKGIIQTDIGVKVSFDWSTLVMVSLSSSYFGNVAGLCGNYNNNKKDEFTTPRGILAVNLTQWAGTWSAKDSDPFCYHYCKDTCPQCSKQDRIRYSGPQYCGILSDKKGPFSRCHSSVPIVEVVSGCLYDVCISKGRREVLCEALSSYVTACQEAGASVSPWRQLGHCSVACPAHSQYKLCGSACPATCGPQPAVCPAVCVEGCFCDPGYVLSGKECVVKEKGCGCNHDNRYYMPGATFWSNSLCEKKCVCDAETQKVKCKQTGCRAGEKCAVMKGVQGCYPISFKSCSVRGDLHISSFDGRKFDFQGSCVYRLAGTCGGNTGRTPFEVNLENNNRGKTMSYAKVVSVNVYGSTYTLSVDHPGRVLVNGLENVLPFSNPSNQSWVRVSMRYRHAVLKTGFLEVSFDYESAVRVYLETSYQSATCGLCGNFNEDPADDLMLPNGKLASNGNEFGMKQWVADVEGCSRVCKGCAPPPPPDFKPPAYTSVCDVITAQDGPMADCLGRVDSKQYHHDCVLDMVLNEGEQQAACAIISDYVDECQRNKGYVKSWRKRRLCWMQCAAKSVYSVAAPGCPLSCTDQSPPAKCEVAPSEGCVCKPGYLLSQGDCVPLAKCSCNFNGQYVASGQKFYPDSDCRRKCACSGGIVSCKDKPCKGKKICGVQNGVRGCYA